MVTQEEHKIYSGSGHELRNTLCPASLWIVLRCDDEVFWGGSLPILYSTRGMVTNLRNLILSNHNCYIHGGYDLRNLILANYNCYICGGYDIYSNRLFSWSSSSLCFLRMVHQVIRRSAWPFLASWATLSSVAHVEPWGYTGLYPHISFGDSANLDAR
jgi:hypothetical protein